MGPSFDPVPRDRAAHPTPAEGFTSPLAGAHRPRTLRMAATTDAVGIDDSVAGGEGVPS